MKKYKIVNYTVNAKVKAEFITYISAHIKFSLKVHCKYTITDCIAWMPFFFLHACLLDWGSDFRSWRGWLVIWRWRWLGSSTKLPGGLDFHLMKRRALGNEWTWCCPRFWVWKEHLHILMKDSLEKIPWRPVNHVNRM